MSTYGRLDHGVVCLRPMVCHDKCDRAVLIVQAGRSLALLITRASHVCFWNFENPEWYKKENEKYL